MTMFLSQADTSNSMDTVNTRLLPGAGNKTGITRLDVFSFIRPTGTCFCFKKCKYGWVWLCILLILAYGRQRQADFCEFLAILD